MFCLQTWMVFNKSGLIILPMCSSSSSSSSSYVCVYICVCVHFTRQNVPRKSGDLWNSSVNCVVSVTLHRGDPPTRLLFRAHYPLVNIHKAIENYDLQWIYTLNMVIFHSYVNVYQRVTTNNYVIRRVKLNHGGNHLPAGLGCWCSSLKSHGEVIWDERVFFVSCMLQMSLVRKRDSR